MSPSADLEAARERWCELCREGEAKGLAGAALGHYVARQLTSTQLLALSREHYRGREHLLDQKDRSEP